MARPFGRLRSTPTCVGKREAVAAALQPTAVHPHVRGEEASSQPVTIAWRGPPPRAWGRVGPPTAGSADLRSTPTCVGKSHRPTTAGTRPTVHPHVRGEEPADRASLLESRGPPPRAWGRASRGCRAWAPARSTPTCVGKSRPPPAWRRGSPVHPHVRGEEIAAVRSDVLRLGPPPRAWGRAAASAAGTMVLGSTPTCVGKSGPAIGDRDDLWVHPHVRGEESATRLQAHVRAGPPPRAWGRDQSAPDQRGASRSTPTCVGKRPLSGGWRCHSRVHPHVRGEEPTGLDGRPNPDGPPPRAWGRGLSGSPGVARGGSTPTCVGKSFRPSPRRSRWPVHPHVRGEESSSPCAAASRCGPPPRAWGRVLSAGLVPVVHRSTPTCVGKRLASKRRLPPYAVHPHVRGEEFGGDPVLTTRTGPPPRAWGRGYTICLHGVAQ